MSPSGEGWPRSGRGLTDHLTRMKPALESEGVFVEFGRTKTARYISISYLFSYVKENYPELIYLENSAVSIDGKLIYGTPYCPIFGYWAFMKQEFELEKIFKGINKKTHILLTHTPAFGTLDVVEGWRSGSEAVVDQIDKLDNLKYHFFGHIHESYGMKDGMKYTSVNSSICNPRGLNNPVILDI